ncbi:probable G-protein coupled receptor Mth-like 12, partial [Drosophila eugracilis]|uniref:probable G-protein coupled receptor Mth-like 12 n=1 Tax=Drosophila eugracilis TaxID=29029 RepID=UPI001BD948CE
MLANGDCSDDLHEEIQQSNRSLSMVHFDKAWHKEEYNLRDMHIIRKHFEPCDEVINVRENEYTILKDGTFYLLALPKRLSNEEYCLYPQFDADFPKSVWLSHHWCKLNALTAAIEVHVISIICVIFTVVVYICVKELRDLLGKCLVCGLLSMLVNYLTALLETFGLATDICVLAGYSRYFLTMAHHLWFSVISYHLWNYFTSLNRSESPNRFRICNIIVWCTAAIPTGVIYLMNAVWGKDLQKWNWLPSIGFIQCSVKGTSRYSWLYQTGPLLFISSFNVIMFILISIHIWKVTNQLKKIVKQEERMKAVLEYDIPTYLRSVRVFIIMGVSWIMPLIMSLAQYFKFPYIIIISSYTES